MLPNIAKLQPMLERMTGPQLQQFAAMHHDDAVAVGLAMQIDKNRKKEVARLQGLMSGQKQPTVIDQAMQALGNPQPPMQGGPQGGAPMPPPGGPQGQMPPQGMPPQGPPGMQMPPQAPPAPQGVAALPAPNMEGMADGGIAGYADEDEAVGYADGGAVHMAAGTPESMFDNVSEEDMRARGRAYGISEDAIDRFIQNRKGAASASQRQLPSAPVTTGVVGAPKVTSTPFTGSELWAGQEPMFDFIKRGIGNLLPGGERKEYDIAANRALELPLVEAAVQQQRDIRRPTRNIAAPSAEEYAATMPPPSAPPPPAAAPTEPARTFADVYRSLGGDQRLTAGAKTGIGTGARKVATPSIAGIDSLIPEGAMVGKTPEQAIADAGKFSLGQQYTEGQTLLNRAGERQDQYLRDIFMQRPSKEIGQKTEEYIKSQREELAAEKKDRSANFLISAGLAIASGTSRNAMQNIAQGLQVGVKDAKDAMKDFKAAQKELARMDADLENLRAAQKERDFDRVFSLEQRIADRDEGRKQKMFDGAMTLAGQDRALAGSIYSLAEQNAEQWRRTRAQFGFQQGERRESQAFTKEENAANRAASAANTQAQIQAQERATLFAASLPSAQAKFYAELGGALPGTVPTSTQIRKGVEYMNSVNDIDTALAAYEKQALEHAKVAATTGVPLPPMKDKQAWIKEFMENKRAYSLYNQGVAGGQIPTTSTPGKATVYER
jgi:hypothetical protein